MIPGIVAGGHRPATSGGQLGFLLHCDGVPGENLFPEVTGKVVTSLFVTTENGPAIAGQSASFLASTASALSLAYHSSIDLSGVGAIWTFETAVCRTAGSGSNQILLDSRGSQSLGINGVALYINASHQLALYDTVHGNIDSGAGAMAMNALYRVAFVKTATHILFFVEGVLVAAMPYANVTANDGNSLWLGNEAQNFGTQRLRGYQDEIRFWLGAALYTSDYTPNAGPFSP